MAAELLADSTNNLEMHFHIIGEGKLRLEMEKLSHQLGIDPNVTFHGHRTDIPSCIASLDCIVMCSDHEGTPMTALEAMILGTPVVAHAVGGLKELLIDIKHHFLNEIHTPSSYAQYVILALQLDKIANTYPAKITAEHNSRETLRLYAKITNN
jgi:L-malate glycosyltransferase